MPAPAAIPTPPVAPEPAPASDFAAPLGTPASATSAATDSDEPCPACGERGIHLLFTATDRFYGTTDKTFHVVECGVCRLIRLSPQPTPAELHRYYPPNYWFAPEASTADHLEQWYRRFVLRDHLQFVERAMREAAELESTLPGAVPGMILDVGCGGGLFLEVLRERGAGRGGRQLAGLDFSLDAAHMTWQRARVPAVCGTLSRAPFAPGSCLIVTMFHVLEHLYDPASYLEGAHQLLAPEGRLVVQVPNAACWQFLLLGERWSGIDVPRHLIDFKLKDLDTLLDSCGFEVLRHKHFSLRDNPAGMATSLAPSLDPMARRIRKVEETPGGRLFKDLLYLALVGASLPFTLLEAACRAGSTIMVEARKKP